MSDKSLADSLSLILAGIFIASLISCNLIIQKFFFFFFWLPFIGYYTFQQSVRLLVYPITFLMTDIISEIYGMKKANRVVIAGLFASLFMLLVVTISNHTTAVPWSPVDGYTFNKVFGLSGAAVFASMMAYLFAQFIDVRVFHFWKNLTNGKHLWLRNNASTIFSQFVDTFIVLFLLCYLNVIEWDMFSKLLLNGFLFKVFFAVFDTPIFYLLSWYLKKKFRLRDNVDLSTIRI
jgi:hypothetical protein